MNIPELLTDLTTHYNALIRYYASQLSLTAPQAFHLLAVSTDSSIGRVSLSPEVTLTKCKS